MIDKCKQKYQNELEIVKMLNKIKEAHSMLGGLQSKDQKEMLKYSNDRVIDNSSSAPSSGIDSDTGLPENSELKHVIGISIAREMKIRNKKTVI